MDSVCVVCVCATILYIPAIAPPLRSFSDSFSSFVLCFFSLFWVLGSLWIRFFPYTSNYSCVSYSIYRSFTTAYPIPKSVLGAPHILFIHVYSFVPFLFAWFLVSYLPHDTAHTNYPSDY
ncbi:hypothetical protein BJ912DRAFT_1002465 [Pholiota molesta]|nr:hypothetical protein BJ912DRAFT_1002465 [Pholiota molesta]